MKHSRSAVALLCAGVALLWVAVAGAQDPANSADHPPGNVNELTLAGIRPGLATLAQVEARFGRHWDHPSASETDVYDWCDARSGVQLRLEVNTAGQVRVVTLSLLPANQPRTGCTASIPLSAARSGRGVRLGASRAALGAAYGKPFFEGPSDWKGDPVTLVVFNFSWAGTDKPQILETSLDPAGKLVRLNLSAEYY